MGTDAGFHIEGPVQQLEHRRWINWLFRGPIIVRLNRARADGPRMMIRFQQVRDCVLPDDRDRLVQSDPQLSSERLDEAATRLDNLWRAAGRPSIFEVV